MFDIKSEIQSLSAPCNRIDSDSLKPALAWIMLHHCECSVMFSFQCVREINLLVRTDFTVPVQA